MKINYNKNSHLETINALLKAVEFEKIDMLLTLNYQSQERENNIIKSDVKSTAEKKLAEENLVKLQNEAILLEKQLDDLKFNHQVVVDEIACARNEHTANNVNAVRTILRLSACDENNKFFKLAIVEDVEFKEFFNSMVTLHDMHANNINENGLRSYTKQDLKLADQLEADIQTLLKSAFSISIENELTKKVNIKFNKTDMNIIHETFVTGIKVDMKKNKTKDGDVFTSIEGMSYNYAIKEKKNKDGGYSYEGARFKETLAKIAFAKLFK